MATIYYYYAYMENGKCVDVERSRIKRDTNEDYIEITKDEYEASYDEDTSSPYYIIGKSWNGEEWYIDNMYYYAIIDEDFICRNFEITANKITDVSFISINKGDFDKQKYLNQRYDRDEQLFYAVPFTHYANADSTMISINGTDVTLQQTLDAIQNAIADNEVNITANDVIELLKSVDGESSGLDADTFDGRESSDFVSVAEYQTGVLNIESSMTDKYNTLVELLNGVSKTVSAIDTVQKTLDNVNEAVTSIPSMEYALNEVYSRTNAIANIETIMNAINDKVNEILLSSSGASSAIKNVQRGYFEVRDGASTETVIKFETPINPDKSIVLINGCRRLATGQENDALAFQEYALNKLTSTDMTLSTTTQYNVDDYGRISWQVIEFM